MRVSWLSLIGRQRKRVQWQGRRQGGRARGRRPAALSMCLDSEVIASIVSQPSAAVEASDSLAELMPRPVEKEEKS